MAGGYISLYFSLVYYKIIKPDFRWIPSFCRVEESTCVKILDTPAAHLFGLPNSIFGLGYYAAILFLPIEQFELFFLIASLFSVGLGMYLTHMLVVRLRIHCVLCYIAHIINLVIANLFILKAL